MQVAHIAFGDRRFMPREFAHVANGIVMVQHLEVVLEGLAAYGNSFLDNVRGFDRAERIALDRVRCIGKLDVVIMLKIGERFSEKGRNSSSRFFFAAIEVENSLMTPQQIAQARYQHKA
jgi:hypothetical protein